MLHVETIVCPTDFSSSAAHALSHAAFLARVYGARLHVLHVVELPALSMPHIREDYFVEHKKKAEAAIVNALSGEDLAGVAVERIVVPGPEATPAGPAIVEYARQHDADLIVIGTHGRRGMRRLFMGSVAEEVVREAPCPVLTVRAEADDAFPARPVRRILAPLDFSAHSERALLYATELAALYHARLVLLHVLYEPIPRSLYGMALDPGYGILQEVETWVNQKMAEAEAFVRKAGIEVETHIEKGHPADRILDFASRSDIDVLVMASHGLTGLDRFVFGNVAEKVIREAPAPVFVLKAFGKDVADYATSENRALEPQTE
ncbi:MAG: universal stress protein [Rhodothermales bacterium]